MPLHSGRTLKRTCLGVLLLFLITVDIVDCQLVIAIIGSSNVDARVGQNLTLPVRQTGAENPTIVWRLDDSPIATWTLGSSDAPQIPERFSALGIDSDGSLTFSFVRLNHSGVYKVRMVQPGVGEDTAIFTLRVFDDIENVSVSSTPEKIKEDINSFSLHYSTLKGEADSVKWFFNGKEIVNGTRYIIGDKSLTVRNPTRGDTGRYTLNLTNPFSSAIFHKDVSVLYGPDKPVLGVTPEKSAYELGDSLSLSCGADGDPAPSVFWHFGGHNISEEGTLNLTNVQINQTGVYTCVLVNYATGDRLEKTFTINVYERPTGRPVCSVSSNGTEDLQYRCQWLGGIPEANLSFPALNGSISGNGDFSLPVMPSQDLDGEEITCVAIHPLQEQNCSVTARGPGGFLPLVSTTMNADNKLVVIIDCGSATLPVPTVTWSRGGQVITSGGRYEISPDTTLLSIIDPALNISDLGIYVCQAANPLSTVTNNVRVLGPTISESSLSSNEDGTMVTLTWKTPSTSIITGFDVQMTGPDLTSGASRRRKRATDEFRTVQNKSANARSTVLGQLDPKSHYRFRVVPVAGQKSGEPSKEHRVGPGGLSEAQIAGLAAGIPCGFLLLLLLILLIVFCVCKRRRRQTRYPVSRTVDKVGTAQPNLNAPHKLLTGGMKSLAAPPNYQVHSERSGTLPSGASPPPVRMATTV
ncbi:hypothetical protein GJAV_G00002740 [Gymnothorax javanicus]|nr:hypothetical protein GJAV_G00002740 [Gymnothorax javanicus]